MNTLPSPIADQILVLLSGLPAHLALKLKRQIEELAVLPEASMPATPAALPFLGQVRCVVEAMLPNSNFGVEWLAYELGLSARQLQRRLRASARVSAGDYIRRLRLQRAAELLSQGEHNVGEVAYAVGFRDVRHFSRVFRRSFGVAPSQFSVRAQALHHATPHYMSRLAPVPSSSRRHARVPRSLQSASVAMTGS